MLTAQALIRHAGPLRGPAQAIVMLAVAYRKGPVSPVSFSSFALMLARRVTLEPFPTWVRGSASMSSRRSGHLYLARPAAPRYAQMSAIPGGFRGSRGTT